MVSVSGALRKTILTDDNTRAKPSKMKNCLQTIVFLNAPEFNRIEQRSSGFSRVQNPYKINTILIEKQR